MSYDTKMLYYLWEKRLCTWILTAFSIFTLTGKPLVDIYETGDIGLSTNEGTLDDPFVEFICYRQKNYGYEIILARLL